MPVALVSRLILTPSSGLVYVIPRGEGFEMDADNIMCSSPRSVPSSGAPSAAASTRWSMLALPMTTTATTTTTVTRSPRPLPTLSNPNTGKRVGGVLDKGTAIEEDDMGGARDL